MRQPFIAGNWKMNLNRQKCVDLASAVAQETAGISGVEVAVCPPSVYLEAVKGSLGDSQVGLGAQNMHHEAEGAYTGEISPVMVVDIGCSHVILGHSERRHLLGESDEFINKKVQAAHAAGLVPIVCVGETLEEREAGQTEEVVRRQVEGSLNELTPDQMQKTVIAYEPVWAIGTGKVATPEQAEEVHLHLRKLLEERYNAEVAQAVRIQYGGSVKPGNAAELLAQPNVDGALVGGASLKPEDFVAIVLAASKTAAE